MDIKSKIGIGTVQFGLPYGISNNLGQTLPDEVSGILDYAKIQGIEIIDTASVYGNSEEVLGRFNLVGFKVISKFFASVNGPKIYEQLQKSLSRLNTQKLYGYLAHHPQDFITNPKLWDELCELKISGLVEKIGFSFNEPVEVDEVLKNKWIPDIIQVPFNYFDTRFYKKIVELKSMGCEIHTRSAFLQGLFFTSPNDLPSFFNYIKPYLIALQKHGEKLPGLLLHECLKHEVIDRVIIGVNNKKQLINNLESLKILGSLPQIMVDIPNELITPSKWQLQ